MMNIRHIVMASRNRLWNRAARTVVSAPTAASGVESSADPMVTGVVETSFSAQAASSWKKKKQPSFHSFGWMERSQKLLASSSVHERLEDILWHNDLEHDSLSKDVLKLVKSLERNQKRKGTSSTQGIYKKLEDLWRLKNLERDKSSQEIFKLVKSMENKKMHGTSSNYSGDTIADAAAQVQPSVVKLFVAKGFYGDTTSESTGSGTIIHESGLILTCAHVVLNTLKMNQTSKKKFVVTLTDGASFNGEVVLYDLDIDIAIVKIQHKKSFPAAKLGVSSKVCVGDWVVTIGSPLGLQKSITAGVVSCVNRLNADVNAILKASPEEEYLQTDCSTNPGNSGGAVVNLNGEVVGVHFFGGHKSISCAVRIDRCSGIIKKMRDKYGIGHEE